MNEFKNTDGPETRVRLLDDANRRNRKAESQFISSVYDELRQIAARHMVNERWNHTLQPTALVNEVYLRLTNRKGEWQNRAHFFATAAHLMRHVLIDYARTRTRGKRGGVQHQVTLHEYSIVVDDKSIDLAALDEALNRLEQIDPRQTRIVELRFFGGLSIEEIGTALHISPRTVRREWSMARAWLYGEITRE